jgi:hypothetical protein
MGERPDGAALLDLARRVLHDEVLAELPETARYRARLVGKAMAIAGREGRDGEVPLRAVHAALAALYGEGAPDTAAERVDEAVLRLSWWLVAEIRAGRRDGDAQVHGLLCEVARERLRVVDPKALGEEG